MNPFMRNGQQKGVQFADGWKIMITIKLSYATGTYIINFLTTCLASILVCGIQYFFFPNTIKLYQMFSRCQIAVHQECYGARNVQDFTSWVCRACEEPDVKRECCLCPVKGVWIS